MSEFGAPCSENERVFLSRLWFSDNEQPARLHLPSYYDWVKREKTNVFATHSELHVKQLVANGNRVADVVSSGRGGVHEVGGVFRVRWTRRSCVAGHSQTSRGRRR